MVNILDAPLFVMVVFPALPFVVPVGTVPLPKILREVTFAKPEDILILMVLPRDNVPAERLIVTSPDNTDASDMHSLMFAVVRDEVVPMFPFQSQEAWRIPVDAKKIAIAIKSFFIITYFIVTYME